MIAQVPDLGGCLGLQFRRNITNPRILCRADDRSEIRLIHRVASDNREVARRGKMFGVMEAVWISETCVHGAEFLGAACHLQSERCGGSSVIAAQGLRDVVGAL